MAAMTKFLTGSWPGLTKLMFNLWTPFWGNGITVTHVNEDLSRIDARLRLKRRSANAVGTMFGGSLFTFADPFYMIILLKHIGKTHYVWDKSSSMEFISPGRSDINFSFSFTKQELSDIVEQCKSGKPLYKSMDIELRGADGNIVAKLNKVIYIRKKPDKSRADKSS